jgi:hypothetical protein
MALLGRYERDQDEAKADEKAESIFPEFKSKMSISNLFLTKYGGAQ